MSESISRSNRGSRNRSMGGRAGESGEGELPGNDTDVKIASKAVAIKSNTRVRPKKLVREGDLGRRAGDK